MRVAFYAPLKPPDHPVPSGDRTMARLLMRALAGAGMDVQLASRQRTFSAVPDSAIRSRLERAARAEAAALVRRYTIPAGAAWRPQLWFTYHLYYKAPDWLGPAVARALAIPYVTAEASYAGKRDRDPWQPWQAAVVGAIRASAVNFSFTERDRLGIAGLGPPLGLLVALPPFVDVAALPGPRGTPTAGLHATGHLATGNLRLVTVAMMRPGDKLASYRVLADALAGLLDRPWTLDVVGGGPAEVEVREAFQAVPPDRIRWHGALPADAVADCIAGGDMFVWPGIGEAFGMAYLEAQAQGLPVAALDIAGVASVVVHERTGLLAPAGSVTAYRDAIARLLVDHELRIRLGAEARRFVVEERSLSRAATLLRETLEPLCGRSGGVTR